MAMQHKQKRKPHLKKQKLTPESLKKIAERLYAQAGDMIDYTDPKTKQTYQLKSSSFVSEFILQMNKCYAQTVMRLREAGYLVLIDKNPETYYIFTDLDLSRKLFPKAKTA
jgi:hypothetical protein